jgi:hypothetical protein
MHDAMLQFGTFLNDFTFAPAIPTVANVPAGRMGRTVSRHAGPADRYSVRWPTRCLFADYGVTDFDEVGRTC